MTNRITNQLNMVGACIHVAENKDNKDVWTGHEPAEFEAGFGQIKTDYGKVTAIAASATGATGGVRDAKVDAETALEDSAFMVARALNVHFKKTGDVERRGKVNCHKTDIVQLTGQPLVAKAVEIRDIAAAAQSEQGAAGRGLTADRISALNAAIDKYQNVMNKPRGQIVNRSTLLKEIETSAADLVEQLHDLDDLILQFGGTDAGKQFIEIGRAHV